MPNSLSESALVKMQGKLSGMFAGDTPTQYGYNEPGFAAAALMENQGAETRDINIPGVKQGKQVLWLKPGSSTITQSGLPATVAAALACDVGSGQFPESDKLEYNDNVAEVAVVSVEDNVLDNFYNDAPTAIAGTDKVATLLAERMRKAQKDLRQKLDLRVPAFLHANRTTVNNASILPNGITFSEDDDRFVVADASRFSNPDLLTELDVIVANNNMQSYFMLSGQRNFYSAVVNSEFRQRNADERFLARFGTANMYFDIRNLDATLDTGSDGFGFTFAIGEGTYAIWNRTESPMLPTQIDYDKWRFTIPDEVLMINENGILRPVYYEVVYQKVCVGRDDHTHHYFRHNFEIKFLGGIAAAPADSDGHTGILEIVGQQGV